jgi:hypothetical protein
VKQTQGSTSFSKDKDGQMGLHQVKKLLHSKGRNQPNEETTYRTIHLTEGQYSQHIRNTKKKTKKIRNSTKNS